MKYEEKFKKLPRKFYEKFKKKNWSVINISEISKKVAIFEKILCKFWNSSRFLKNAGKSR